MAKKADLLAEAKELGRKVTEKNTIAEIEAAIADAPKAEAPAAEPAEEAATAKAGKRSAKAIAEAEAKAEKEARKEAGDTSSVDGEAPAAPKGPKPVTRPLIERRGKAYQAAAKHIDSTKLYSLDEAVESEDYTMAAIIRDEINKRTGRTSDDTSITDTIRTDLFKVDIIVLLFVCMKVLAEIVPFFYL